MSTNMVSPTDPNIVSLLRPICPRMTYVKRQSKITRRIYGTIEAMMFELFTAVLSEVI